MELTESEKLMIQLAVVKFNKNLQDDPEVDEVTKIVNEKIKDSIVLKLAKLNN